MITPTLLAQSLFRSHGIIVSCIIGDGELTWYFDRQANGTYLAHFAGGTSLTYNAGTDIYSFFDGSGNSITFAGFSNQWGPQAGRFRSMVTGRGRAPALRRSSS